MAILKSERTRLAFRFGRISGRVSGLHSANDIVDQLGAQIHQLQARLKTEREHHEKEIAALTREMLQLKYELAKRDMIDAFANTPSPSAMKH
jgi:Skp family chaperone for outer membrane proteins